MNEMKSEQYFQEMQAILANDLWQKLITLEEFIEKMEELNAENQGE